MVKSIFYPNGKHAAVVVSFDDVFPAYYLDNNDSNPSHRNSYLGILASLLNKHEQLVIDLFTVPNWREKNPIPTRKWLSRLPILNNHCYLSPVWPENTLSLERHPEFCTILKALPRVEIAVHGLHHVSKGQPIFQEFRGLSLRECLRRLESAEAIFERIGLSYARGFTPPGWEISYELLQALQMRKYQFIASARDLRTEITMEATTKGNGLRNLPLLFPSIVPNSNIIHIPSNWSRTSTIERADRILELGGVLSIKGHAVKKWFNHTAVDGLDEAYSCYLDKLFDHVEERWGKDVWWTSMGELSNQYRHGYLSNIALSA